MTPTPEVQERLRRYLLGQVADDARAEIEKTLLTDGKSFEELQIVEDELIDEYLGGKLDAADHAAFEHHFLATPERHDNLRFGRAFKRYLSSQTTAVPRPDATSPLWWGPARAFFSSPWRAVAFAAAALVIAFGAWQVFVRQSPVDEGLLALNSAFREQRPLESRISNLSYAPYVVTRGPGDDRTNQEELRRAELTLLNAQKKNSTPAVQHALGKVYLARKDLDRAIEQFNTALKNDPKNAQVYSDLGAAWLEKGKTHLASGERGKGTEELGRGLDALNKALELDPTLLEALFNRALCLQYLLLPQAETAWREYLKKDSTSPWAAEAARNLKKLEEEKARVSSANPVDDFWKAYEASDHEAAWQIVTRHRDFSGGRIVNTLIDSYLELAGQGQSEQTARTLNALTQVARLERDKASDLFVQDVVSRLSLLTPEQRASMIESRRLLKLGQQKILVADDSEGAIDPLSRAKENFERLGDKADAIYIGYLFGHLYLAQKKSELALTAFDQVVRDAESSRYRWLMAQALNATANTQMGLTNHSAALEASERSLNLSKEIGDSAGVIKTTNQLGSQYFRLGNYEKSLDRHQESLAAAHRTSVGAMQLWRNYFGMAMPLQALGLHAAAIEFAKEALSRAQALKQPTEISRSYCVLGLMYASDGKYDEAIRYGDAALDAARKIPGERARQEGLAYSTLQLAVIYRESGDPARAISNYDQALASYRALDNFAAFVYVAHKGKLLSCIRMPGCPSVEEEIRTSLVLFEGHRANIREVSNRLPFFDVEQGIYDIASEYEFSRQNYQRSFEYSEQARAGTLREMTASNATLIGGTSGPDIKLNMTSPAMTLSEVQVALPASAQVIQYAVLKNRLLIWLISNSQFVHAERTITLADLNDMVQRYQKLISSPASSIEDIVRDGSALYDILIKPVGAALSRDRLLCIVPDKTLNNLPFAALVPEAGKYLMDEFTITRAPSSTMFVTSSDSALQRARVENESLLSVGNPEFDHARFPQLQDLPSAEKEAREIKRFYEPSRTTLLVGHDAVRSRVTSGMREADVVHLALHSIVDEQAPFRSRLILAKDRENGSEENGVLRAYEIYGARNPVTRLVVLSGCDTNRGRYYAGEGVTGLAQTFLATGVPLVVASLWEVDSGATADLMIEFHRLRKTEKLATVEALRKAQQHLAHDGNSPYAKPYYWAGFTVSGGYATF